MNCGDFSNMLAKMKETLKQTFNLKSINNEIKLLSEQFLSITKKNESEIFNETNYGKYELSYSPLSNNDNIIETDNILPIFSISFFSSKKGKCNRINISSYGKFNK